MLTSNVLTMTTSGTSENSETSELGENRESSKTSEPCENNQSSELCKTSSIHSKSEKVCGVCFSVTKKSADKVRKSRHKICATKVRKSIKSLKMHHLKAKCKKI